MGMSCCLKPTLAVKVKCAGLVSRACLLCLGLHLTAATTGAAFFICLLMAFPTAVWAEVYLNKDQALKVVLGEGCEIRYQPQRIPEAVQEELSDKGIAGLESDVADFFVCLKGGKSAGYALIDSEVGKHLPITYIVGLTPKGEISRVEIMVFREVRGWEVRERRFLDQFAGKHPGDPLEVGTTISNISGATLSSQAIARGARRAFVLWRHFYGSSSS